MTDKRTRKIEVGALSRVEGEGALRVSLQDGRVTDVQLAIYEPPRFFEALLRQRPLEVGADKIARTARAALEMLQEVREATGETIPLAWDPGLNEGVHAIEVYPAATLKAYLGEVPKYKDDQAARRKLLAFLAEHLRLPEDTSAMENNADALDAGLCVLGAVDFLRGDAMEPEDQQKAWKEGWIWVRG